MALSNNVCITLILCLMICITHGEDVYIVAVDPSPDGIQSQSLSVKANIESLFSAQVVKEINIGDLSFLVTKSSKDAASQMTSLPGVRYVEQNLRVHAFPVIDVTQTTDEEVTDFESGTTDSVSTTTMEEEESVTTEEPKFCYAQDTGTSLWGLTRMVRRTGIAGFDMEKNR